VRNNLRLCEQDDNKNVQLKQDMLKIILKSTYIGGILTLAIVVVEAALAMAKPLETWADRFGFLLVPGMALVSSTGNSRIHDADFWIWATLANWIMYAALMLVIFGILRFKASLHRE